MPAAPISRSRRTLRTVGMAVALLLGAVGLALVVLGKSQKMMSIGIVIGLWGIATGYIATMDPRHHSDAHDDADGTDPSAQLAMIDDFRERYEMQLEVMLRREIERVLRSELADLRGEVSGLRGEMNEKFDGQLRLERIETTRVIGSDIQSLHEEVRRLAVARDDPFGAPAADWAKPAAITQAPQSQPAQPAAEVASATDQPLSAASNATTWLPAYDAAKRPPVVTNDPSAAEPPTAYAPPAPVSPAPAPAPVPPAAPLYRPAAPAPATSSPNPSPAPAAASSAFSGITWPNGTAVSPTAGAKTVSNGAEATKPDSSTLGSVDPQATRPESGRLESGRPESSKPESGRPESTGPEPVKPSASWDPFADMPRIGVFSSPDLLPDEPPASSYVGRRRPNAEEIAAAPKPAAGRRRRADGEDSEVLNRVLGHDS
ncbi:hypothetical protein SAMN05892883_0249 [Jatrophihabitans sp. GAS493]|uniref:DUF6779 domain-containing protein n=1 Tax=Jatrophihabitans sp. GAS493 TaxID=1907575 RepID=UPI000BB8C366|nr:DUF6779 domain-containing protein [Jatrophihabitans sp. GAS493]SOD70561.1 hypothetical protein SAMN05892883_0249 [Jatrophihabitans sp. GAS493]